jgi:homoserine kinase type II
MPGSADYKDSPKIERLRSALRALAQFHVATVDFERDSSLLSVGRQAESAKHQVGTDSKAWNSPSTSAILGRRQRLQQLADGGVEEMSLAITQNVWPDLAPLARRFLAALPRALPHALAQLEPLLHTALPVQPCLRDIWHDHVLFTGNDVTGIIDFGAVEIDTPAIDIARLLGSFVGDDAAGWKIGLAAYSTVRPLSEDELRAVTALDTSGTLLAGCNWIRWIYADGRTFENHAQVIERFRTILARIHGAGVARP